jgi:hypothetical protein
VATHLLTFRSHCFCSCGADETPCDALSIPAWAGGDWNPPSRARPSLCFSARRLSSEFTVSTRTLRAAERLKRICEGLFDRALPLFGVAFGSVYEVELAPMFPPVPQSLAPPRHASGRRQHPPTAAVYYVVGNLATVWPRLHAQSDEFFVSKNW